MGTWHSNIIRVVLVLWLLQVLWLAWHFGPEAGDAGKRLTQGAWGEAVRAEDPYYRWLVKLQDIIPPRSAYVFLDRYEAGKYIAARYHLYPRRQVRLAPQTPPGFLYFHIRRHQASHLLIRDPEHPLAPATQAALASSAFQRLELPGPGLAFEVAHARLHGDFYD
jgi:hypothetical protein